MPEKQRQKVLVETDKAIIKEIKGVMSKTGCEQSGFEEMF